MKKNIENFGSKLGLLAATAGSAIGLGNVWRFPNEVQDHGGGAFLIVYVISLLLLGIPTMLAEFAIGRAGKSDCVGAFKNTRKGGYWWVCGLLGIVASYLIFSFYTVVAGWTLEYLWNAITGSLFDGFTEENSTAFFSAKMTEMTQTSYAPLYWSVVVLVINLLVLLKGVQKGIEVLSNWLMPLLFVLLIIFCVTTLSMPGASKGLDFFLMPDLSKFDINTVINALGQAFFSMSLGMGILVTYAAYFPDDTKLTQTAVKVSLLDLSVSIMMGLIIFPAMMNFGIECSDSNASGTNLVFVTMPHIFTYMPMPRLWAVLFFALLAIAAITSTISLCEVAIAFVRDRMHFSRTKACFVVIIPMIVLSAICSLSLGLVPSLQIAGKPVFDFFDYFTANIMLTISAFCICVYVGWVLPKNFLEEQLGNRGSHKASFVPALHFLIKYVCPLLILCLFVAKMME